MAYVIRGMPKDVREVFYKRATEQGWRPATLIIQLMRDYAAGRLQPSVDPPAPLPIGWQPLPVPTREGDVVVTELPTATAGYRVWPALRDAQQRADTVATSFDEYADAIGFARRMAGKNDGAVFVVDENNRKWILWRQSPVPRSRKSPS